MATTNRDNFTQATINLLKRRVSGICSNPDCYVQTSEPQLTDTSKVNETGIAAHICAAAIGGPRYNSTMTQEERKHINNGIWLCSTCATKIDREPDLYPTPLLHRWKNLAEQRIKQNLNQKLYTQSEAEYQVNHSLLQASGISVPRRIQSSLSEIAKAINQHINHLDPRLDVHYSFINGHDYFNINIKENTEEAITVKFTPVSPKEYTQKFQDLLDHGHRFSCDISKIMTNSSGLNVLLPTDSEDATLTIEPNNKRKAVVEIENEEGNSLVTFEDVLILGRTTFSFFSQKFEGLLTFNINQIPYKGGSIKDAMNLNLNVHLWDNKLLSQLNYFEQIFKLYKTLSNLNKFSIKIYIEGLLVFSTTSNIPQTTFYGLNSLLSYTYYSSLLCNILKIEIPFQSEITFTAEEHQDIFETVEALKTIEIVDDFSCDCTLFEDKNLSIIFIQNSNEITIEQNTLIEIDNIFNLKIYENVYIRHIFKEANISLTKDKISKNQIYKVKIDNSNRLGKYFRTTTLDPLAGEKK
ncbi:hypothetical protein F935_03454 [Acinetobacter calcoaceticus ANC 3811]|uniref:HNH endonuclease n=2 Tax=Acinetobacter TaxID=469 RepID=R8XVB7_ACICA|nr:hypothetical protein [Acinetobacter calcoaceticus]EOQ61108.1 hypothetical protein F935_03454 [Acinetobacter calcoaceticus ANC 3811]KHN67954.1 hypothetical protein DH17_09480 [Acinetobacter oleivorans]KUM13829.1 hypothetical protein AV645_12835 [Acinetobacter calcoaceticus]